MKVKHVFSSHSMLQEQLADAIMREAGIHPDEVIMIRARGSFRPEEKADYLIRDGGRYRTSGGYNFLKHRRRNRAAYERFRSEVLDLLAPDFQVYSAMYTYWYLHELKRKATSYHVLEDGFGSYQTLEEQQSFHRTGVEVAQKNRLLTLRRRLCQLPVQRPDGETFLALLAGVDQFYTTSAACFPWVEDARKSVVTQPFLPRYVGEYSGATVLATSCMVETGVLTLSEYLPLLRRVVQRLVDRKIERLYYKLHPAQAANVGHARAYRDVFAEFADRIEFAELPQGTSIESLAAGNPITFITGVSTLAFHVEATGATVLSYLREVEKIGPHATDYLADGGMLVFRQITSPL